MRINFTAQSFRRAGMSCPDCQGSGIEPHSRRRHPADWIACYSCGGEGYETCIHGYTEAEECSACDWRCPHDVSGDAACDLCEHGPGHLGSGM